MFEIHLLWPHLRQKFTKRVDGVYATLFPILSIFSDFCLIECFLIPIFQKKMIIFQEFKTKCPSFGRKAGKRQMSQDSLAKQTWHRSIFCTLRRSSPLKSIFSELFCYNKLLQLEPNRNTHTFLPRQKIQSSIRWDEDFLPLPLAFLIRKQLIMMILLAAGGEWMFP